MINKFLKSFFQIVVDSLFPISNADKLLFSYTPEQALRELPKAPKTPIENTYSVFAYKNELVTRLVWNIKYKKNTKAIQIGGYALYERIINDQLSMVNNQFLLIPIPITQKRRNERGYNQCELLVDEIHRLDRTNGKILTSKDLLVRTVHKDRQTMKNREKRLEDAKNIFSVNKGVLDSIRGNYLKLDLSPNKAISDLNKSVAPENLFVIVIDDVITTGSTMKEAIETLGSAGFDRVIGISLAH